MGYKRTLAWCSCSSALSRALSSAAFFICCSISFSVASHLLCLRQQNKTQAFPRVRVCEHAQPDLLHCLLFHQPSPLAPPLRVIASNTPRRQNSCHGLQVALDNVSSKCPVHHQLWPPHRHDWVLREKRLAKEDTQRERERERERETHTQAGRQRHTHTLRGCLFDHSPFVALDPSCRQSDQGRWPQ